MNTRLTSINDKKITVLGAGKSGIAAAVLAHDLGAKVLLSDIKDVKFNIHNDIEIESGGHSKKIFDTDLIIKSPGISNESSIVKEIRAFSIPIISEIEFASWFTNSFIIALTGSNGKTTTISLIDKIFKSSGKISLLGGNIGIPFSENVLYERKNSNKEIIHLLEISSFQLDDIYHFKPNIAIILNITPDHLDRYENFERYIEAKLKILDNQDDSCHAIVNNNILKYINDKDIKSQIIEIVSPKLNNFDLVFKDEKININFENFNLKGLHNYQNIIFAIIVSKLCSIKNSYIFNSIRKFSPLIHRIELIKKNLGIKYYNDSKSTNLSSTIAAIEQLENNIILILGGIDKNKSNFRSLKDYSHKIKKIIIYGQSHMDINKQISKYFSVSVENNFTDAVFLSIESAIKGDSILLSPACASFDQFKDYQHRGNTFKEIILNKYDA